MLSKIFPFWFLWFFFLLNIPQSVTFVSHKNKQIESLLQNSFLSYQWYIALNLKVLTHCQSYIPLRWRICCCYCCSVASVVSDSVQPHRRLPTRLHHPWDSPGKNTGVGCHFLLQCMKVKSESEVAQLCPTHSDPMNCSLPGSIIHGIFQARVLEWGAISFPQILLNQMPRILRPLNEGLLETISFAPFLLVSGCPAPFSFAKTIPLLHITLWNFQSGEPGCRATGYPIP